MTCENCPWAYGKTYDENDKLRLVVCLPHKGGCKFEESANVNNQDAETRPIRQGIRHD